MPDETLVSAQSETLAADDEQTPVPGGAAFPIVGVGASAGGLEALTQFLKALPVDTGMGFVIVQHLAPERESGLVEILSRATKMPVREVRDEPAVEPDHVYVIPPGREMTIAGGKLQLLPLERRARHRGIDQFFHSLAAECGHQAIAVVLSGAMTDGTLGIEEIKAEGGITFAQDDSAQHGSMPRSAEASGCVDFVLSAAEIAREIARIAKHPYVAPERDAAIAKAPGHGRIAQILHQATGADFTHYKANTLHRRITRRMVLHKMETVAEYEAHLEKTPEEIEALYQDILINVTSFFRDPEAFVALTSTTFPKLLADRPPQEPLRMWTLGCSTGEEAYSLAMAYAECAEAIGSRVPLRIFATDLNATGVAKARAGLYAKSIARDVSPERLRRFFIEEEGGWRVSKAIREQCIFSRHNVLDDPPFSRVDFISCRNVLIYMEPVLQQQIVPLLHYALKPGGCLWLGSSETAGTSRALFEVVDARHKIYVRQPGPTPRGTRFRPAPGGGTADPFRAHAAIPPEPPRAALHKEAERILLTKFAPPGVVISAAMEIVHFRGDTSAYLAPASGAASMDLLKMLREGLLVGVRAAILRAREEGGAVREEGLRLKSGTGSREVAVEVIPITAGAAKESGFLVLFEESATAPHEQPVQIPNPDSEILNSGEAARLTHELKATREYLQDVIEQQEAVNEELQSANEEAQSANEEMQSVNEELETSKEEIQSSNEELVTVNDELNTRNTELNKLTRSLRQARDYAENIVASLRSPLVVLDRGLRVRTASAAFYETFQAKPETTEGRRIYDLGDGQWNVSALRLLLEELLDRTERIDDFEVRQTFPHLGPRVMLLNARRLAHAAENEPLIVLAIEDITEREQAAAALAASEARFRDFVTTSSDVIYRMSADWSEMAPLDGRGFISNSAGPSRTWLHDNIFPEDHAQVLAVIQEAIRTKGVFDLEHRVRRADGTVGWTHSKAVPLLDAQGEITEWFGAASDVTERKRAELNFAFLASVSQDLARLTSVDELMPAIAAKLAAHLQLSLCAFVEIDEAAEQVKVTHDWHRADVPGVVGVYRLADYFTEEFRKAGRAGEMFVVRDTATDPRTFGANFEAHKVGALVSVPLVQDGAWRFFLCIYHSEAWDWREDEIELTRELTARLWTRLERHRTEEALRVSEERYRYLFNAMDEGYCVAEVIFDAQQKAVDYRFLEINPVFERLTGLHNALGKRMREFVPDLEERWFELYGKVVLTGEPVRVEDEAKPMHRWFDVNALRIGGPESRKVAIFFNDITARKVAEQELAEKARLLDLSHDAIIVRDNEGHIRYWNHGAEELYGWLRAEALGKISHLLLQTEFPTPIEQITAELHRTDRWIGELVHTARDGRRLTVLVRKTLDRDTEGHPAAVLENITDITARKLVEATLRESVAFNRSIIESSPDCIKVLDLEGNLLSMESGQALLGIHDATPFLNKSWIDLWQGEDRRAARAAVEAAMATGEGKFVGFFRTLRGEPKWWDVAISPILDSRGEPARLLAVSRDVTERRTGEEALRASEARFRFMAESMPQKIFTADSRGEMDYFNAQWMEYSGLPFDQIKGWGWTQFVHPDDVEENIRLSLRSIETGEPFEFQHRFRRADGEYRWHLTRGHPMRDAAGRITMWIGSNVDIDDIKRAQEALAGRTEDLARADRSKDEFLAMLAHELRNPLAPLSNAAEILQAAAASAEERANAQGILGRQIENMTRMIDDLLDVSRITEGKIELRPQMVALADVLNAAVSVARSSIEARGQELKVSLPAEPVFLNADATRLEQIFANLLGNACKYSDSGCHIALSAEVVPPHESHLSPSTHEGMGAMGRRGQMGAAQPPEVIVRVRDDGIGIAPELLPRIFDLFVQATRSLDRAHGGLGIGLTLVHRLVKLHGGRVEARSEGLGHGSEFSVHLPILARPMSTANATALPAVKDTPRRMLIVDDNEDSARSMATLQRLRGHETRTAFTGPDAVAAAAEFLPNVVLLDIGLPGMDGCEVATRLRTMPALAGAFLVAMSGYGSPEDIARAKQAGFDEYLVKPADLDLLRAWLRRGT